MSSEWELTTLGRVTKWASGGTPKKDNPKYWNGSVPWISASSMKSNRFYDSDLRITEEGLNNGSNLAQKNSILLLVRGSALHTRLPVGVAMRNLSYNQDVKALTADQNLVRPWYLLYWLMGKKAFLLESVVEYTGIGAGKLDTNRMQSLEFIRPSLTEQDKILDVVKPLDDKIEVLANVNSALEAFAQAIFRSWFVDFDPVHAKAAGISPEAMSPDLAALFPSEFVDSEIGHIPKGWHSGTIGDIASNSRTQAKPEKIPANTPYVGLEHVPRRSLSLTSWGSSNELESGKFFFKKDDVLFGKLRPYFHKVVLTPTSGVCSTDILVIRPKAKDWLGFMCMHIFSGAFIEHATQLSDGARMPRTNWGDTAGFKVPLPPDSVVKEYQRLIEPLFGLMHENIMCIRRLTELRDHLLPRLISGKLRIEDAEASIAGITSGLETEPA